MAIRFGAKNLDYGRNKSIQRTLLALHRTLLRDETLKCGVTIVDLVIGVGVHEDVVDDRYVSEEHTSATDAL